MEKIADTLSDNAILTLLGQRLRALRLSRNRTLEAIAREAHLSPRTVLALEHGRGKLENLIPTLRALHALESLDAFLPEPTASPLDLARRQGKVRQRASIKRAPRRAPSERGEPEW